MTEGIVGRGLAPAAYLLPWRMWHEVTEEALYLLPWRRCHEVTEEAKEYICLIAPFVGSADTFPKGDSKNDPAFLPSPFGEGGPRRGPPSPTEKAWPHPSASPPPSPRGEGLASSVSCLTPSPTEKAEPHPSASPPPSPKGEGLASSVSCADTFSEGRRLSLIRQLR